MSSMKHLVKTRTYRERAQPKARQKLGLLEKHKDYVVRARDYHRKEDALKAMREKASLKNQDEFYFNMVNSKLQDGVHRKKDKAPPTEDELAAFTREDINYLTMKQVSESKKVKRLRESMHQLDAAPKNKHTIFVEEGAQAARFRSAKDFAAHLQTPVELLGRSTHRPRVDQGGASASTDTLAVATAVSAPPARSRKDEKAKKAKRLASQFKKHELEQREAREAKLKAQLGKLRREKVLHAKGIKRKVTEDGQPRQFKFKQVRAR